MSMVTVSKKRDRIYTRRFDHDEAIRLHAEDPKTWTYTKLANRFGVTGAAVRRVIDETYREQFDERTREWTAQNKVPCVAGCGVMVQRRSPGSRRSGLCRSCWHKTVTSASVRPDALWCGQCIQWRPDDDYGKGKGLSIRRGRDSWCRQCSSAARRAHRRARPDLARAADGRKLVKQGRKQVSRYVVLSATDTGFSEVGRTEAVSVHAAIESIASDAGKYIAVLESRWTIFDVAPVHAYRIVTAPAADVDAQAA